MSKTKSFHTIAFCDNSLRELIRFRRPVIESFLRKGYKVIAICPQNDIVPDFGIGFKHIDVNLSRGGMNPFEDIRYLFCLLRIYRKEKISYVFHYTIKPNVYGTIAAKLLGIGSTIMITGLGYVFNANNLGSILGRWLYCIALHMSNKVFVLNENIYNLMIRMGIPADKIIFLEGGEGVDLSKFN